jgi:uncharacterized membrane protein HdeD (DUF308 family)
MVPPVSAAVRLRRVFARWWLVLIQGLIGVAFGIWAFIQPALSLWYIVISVSLWMFFAAMAQFALAGAQRAMGGKPVWAILGGIVSLAIGVLALAFPGLTVVAAIAMVAWLSLLGGVLNLIVAFSVGSIGGRSVHATA